MLRFPVQTGVIHIRQDELIDLSLIQGEQRVAAGGAEQRVAIRIRDRILVSDDINRNCRDILRLFVPAKQPRGSQALRPLFRIHRTELQVERLAESGLGIIELVLAEIPVRQAQLTGDVQSEVILRQYDGYAPRQSG